VIRWVVILIPLLLCACQGSKVRQELQRVDSLNSHDIPLDTITTMDAVVDYLDWWGTANERMTAHYLLGSVYRDQDNAPMALRCYRDAVSYADTTASDCDYRRLSRIYGQIADLFNRQRAPRLEIEAERKAVEYAWRAKDTLSAIIFYQLLGNPYHMLNMMDSCLYYNYQAIEMYNKYGYTEYASGNLTFLIDIHLRRNEYHEAKVCMEEFEKNLDEDYYINHSGYFRYWGLYYLGINKLDSAELYFRRVIDNRPNNIPESTLKGMMQIYQQLGIGDSIAKYAELYCQYNDSASFQHSADELTRTQALYNYEEHERIAAKKTAEAKRYKIIIATSLVTFCLLAYACFRYIRKQQRRKKAELMAANQEYVALLGQYKKLQDDMTLSQHNVDEFQKTKEQERQRLLQELAHYQDAQETPDKWNAEQAMLDSPLVLKFHQLASHAKTAPQVLLNELREFVRAELPAFFAKIDSKEALLTPQEVYICMLIRLQFSHGELTALFDVSKQRITNIKRSINKKLFHEDGAQTLNDHLFRL
jgi:tetratricopeptide (TPR) repeat protein